MVNEEINMSETTPLTNIEATAGTKPSTDEEKGEQTAIKSPDFVHRIKDAKEKSKGPLGFLKAFLFLLLDTSEFL